jgi:DNA polymerase delta subunit 2
MLEDESGRIPLVGDRLDHEILVTGVIMAALGMENSNGEFQVIDLCFPGFSPNEHTATTFQMSTDSECPYYIHRLRFQ